MAVKSDINPHVLYEVSRRAGFDPKRYQAHRENPYDMSTDFIFSAVPVDRNILENMENIKLLLSDDLRRAVFKAAVPDLFALIVKLVVSIEKTQSDQWIKLDAEEMRRITQGR